jgi:DNA helicase-2/ATP-dependent DNA helicase PcrA
VLTGQALAAVEHRGSHLQIIAAAGSGKTEVVSQRVASLLADGVAARSIVAFTFTEKAAAELKERITQRVQTRLGAESVGLLVGCSCARSAPHVSLSFASRPVPLRPLSHPVPQS